jgi:hypothetical protein
MGREIESRQDIGGNLLLLKILETSSLYISPILLPNSSRINYPIVGMEK